MKQTLVRQWVAEKATTVQQGGRLLDISRAGFYVANRRLRQPKVLCATRARLQAVFEGSGRCYGSRRLQEALNDEGQDIGRFKVRSLMKELQLKPIWKRKFVHTTDSNHDLPVFDNVLNRQFKPEAANQAWVSDITYIRTLSGWLYLAVVLDLYSRKVVARPDCSLRPWQPICQP